MDNADIRPQEPLEHSVVSSQTLLGVAERDLASADPAVCAGAIQSLLDYLSEGSVGDSIQRRTNLLQESALTIVPLLIDHNAGPEADHNVDRLLDLVASTARPREAYLAFIDALHQLREIEDRDDLSDDEDPGGETLRLKSEDSLARLLFCSICALATVIPRIQGTKCFPMLEPIPGLIRSVLGSTRSIQTSSAADKVVNATLHLASACHNWSQGKTDQGERSTSLCLDILYGALSTHGGPFSNGLLVVWFLDRFPQFAPLRKDPREDYSVPKALLDASAFIRSLGVTDAMLVQQMAFKPHPDPTDVVSAASAAFSALILVATRLAKDRTPWSGILQPSVTDLMPILRNALCGRAPGAALTLLWQLIDTAGEGSLSLDDATDLGELIMPLAASMRDQTARLAAFKLLGAIVNSVLRGSDQIVLLRHMLAEDNPFEQVRVQCLSILRDEIVKAATVTPGTASILNGELLRSLPLKPPESIGDPAVDSLPSPAAAFLTDLLASLRVLYERDLNNLTGIRGDAIRSSLRNRLVDPTLRRAASMREELSGAAGSDPDSAILHFLLERLHAAADSLNECISHA